MALPLRGAEGEALLLSSAVAVAGGVRDGDAEAQSVVGGEPLALPVAVSEAPEDVGVAPPPPPPRAPPEGVPEAPDAEALPVGELLAPRGGDGDGEALPVSVPLPASDGEGKPLPVAEPLPATAPALGVGRTGEGEALPPDGEALPVAPPLPLRAPLPLPTGEPDAPRLPLPTGELLPVGDGAPVGLNVSEGEAQGEAVADATALPLPEALSDPPPLRREGDAEAERGAVAVAPAKEGVDDAHAEPPLAVALFFRGGEGEALAEPLPHALAVPPPPREALGEALPAEEALAEAQAGSGVDEAHAEGGGVAETLGVGAGEEAEGGAVALKEALPLTLPLPPPPLGDAKKDSDAVPQDVGEASPDAEGESEGVAARLTVPEPPVAVGEAVGVPAPPPPSGDADDVPLPEAEGGRSEGDADAEPLGGGEVVPVPPPPPPPPPPLGLPLALPLRAGERDAEGQPLGLREARSDTDAKVAVAAALPVGETLADGQPLPLPEPRVLPLPPTLRLNAAVAEGQPLPVDEPRGEALAEVLPEAPTAEGEGVAESLAEAVPGALEALPGAALGEAEGEPQAVPLLLPLPAPPAVALAESEAPPVPLPRNEALPHPLVVALPRAVVLLVREGDGLPQAVGGGEPEGEVEEGPDVVQAAEALAVLHAPSREPLIEGEGLSLPRPEPLPRGEPLTEGLLEGEGEGCGEREGRGEGLPVALASGEALAPEEGVPAGEGDAQLVVLRESEEQGDGEGEPLPPAAAPRGGEAEPLAVTIVRETVGVGEPLPEPPRPPSGGEALPEADAATAVGDGDPLALPASGALNDAEEVELREALGQALPDAEAVELREALGQVLGEAEPEPPGPLPASGEALPHCEREGEEPPLTVKVAQGEGEKEAREDNDEEPLCDTRPLEALAEAHAANDRDAAVLPEPLPLPTTDEEGDSEVLTEVAPDFVKVAQGDSLSDPLVVRDATLGDAVTGEGEVATLLDPLPLPAPDEEKDAVSLAERGAVFVKDAPGESLKEPLAEREAILGEEEGELLGARLPLALEVEVGLGDAQTL